MNKLSIEVEEEQYRRLVALSRLQGKSVEDTVRSLIEQPLSKGDHNDTLARGSPRTQARREAVPRISELGLLGETLAIQHLQQHPEFREIRNLNEPIQNHRYADIFSVRDSEKQSGDNPPCEGTAMRLPDHGRISCSICFGDMPVTFDRTKTGHNEWRITNNPCAWGNPTPQILVLGFSKGPTQAGALATIDHDLIAAKGARSQVRQILHAIGLIGANQDMEALFADRSGRFGFGSLIRCTVERWNAKAKKDADGSWVAGWAGTGGDMLGGFIADKWGKEVVTNCISQFLGRLPPSVRLVVLFGFGKNGTYVDQAEQAIRGARGNANWRRISEVAYTDGRVTFVHVEHFRSQGRFIPDWLGHVRKDGSPPSSKRTRWRLAAIEAVRLAFRSEPARLTE